MANAPERFRIFIAADESGVLRFHTWQNKVPEGIQVLGVSGGGSTGTTTPATEAFVKYEKMENARLWFDSFIEHCSINTVNVSVGQRGYCTVYVNFVMDKTKSGRNDVWWDDGNAYAPLLRSLFRDAYQSAKIRREEGKVSVLFSHRRIPLRAVEKQLGFAEDE